MKTEQCGTIGMNRRVGLMHICFYRLYNLLGNLLFRHTRLRASTMVHETSDIDILAKEVK